MNKNTLLAAMLFTSSALADVDPFDMSLEDILSVKVEVATLTAEEERDIPAAVSVITEKEWERFGAHRGSHVLDRITGLTTSSFFGNYIIGVRGFNSTNAFRKVAYVLDGVSVNRYSNGSGQSGLGNILDLYLLEKIEVAKGPISNIYGSNAMLGAVSMSTWSPKVDSYEGNISIGSFGYDNFGARASKKIFNDYRLTIGVTQRDIDNEKVTQDFIQSGVSKKGTTKRAWSKKAALLKITKNDFNFSLIYSEYRYFDFPSFELSNNYDPRAFSRDPNDFTMIKIEDSYTFSGLKLKAALNAMQGNASLTSNATGDGLPGAGELASINKARENGFGAKLHLSPKVRDDFNWFVATEYTGNRVPLREGALGDVATELNEMNENGKRYQLSLVGNIDYPILKEKLNIHIGGRVDKYTDDGTHYSPRAALVYHQSEDLTFKLLYSDSYRAPDLGVKAGSAPFFVLPADKLKAEKMRAYEAIALYKKRNLRVFFSLFSNKLKDEIQTLGQTAPYSKGVNTRDGKSSGVEFEYRYSANAWIYDFSSTYLMTRDAETAPKTIVNWSLGKEYKKWFFSLNAKHLFNYHSSAYANPRSKFEVYKMSRFFDLGLHVDYSIKELGGSHLISLDIKNILDRENFSPYNASRQNGHKEAGLGVFGSYKFKY
ncbi:MAG: hypothetical protein BM556_00995 [Bacteriovorax sp. MedPE-SWde]|nr:MAG: hypothetical protein BM556_00995 [Bacteriovorax sp. MedPE-SWde]